MFKADTVKRADMALTDTFVNQIKHTGKASGDKHADGGGMYLLVKASGRQVEEATACGYAVAAAGTT